MHIILGGTDLGNRHLALAPSLENFEGAMKGEKQPGHPLKLQYVRKGSQAENLRAHCSPFSSPCFSSSPTAVHRRSVRRHSQVLRFVHLLRCVPSQPLRFR